MLDKAYASHFRTNGIFSTNTKKIEVPQDKFKKIILKEKEMIADIITSELEDANNFVEFSNAFYLDGELFPTISEKLAKSGKNATLISPHVKTNLTKEGLSTIKTSIDRPFYNYDEIMSSKLIKELEGVGCFITENKSSRLMNHFKTWAGVGIPCVFAATGELDGRFKKYSDDIDMMFKKATTNNMLEYKVSFDYDSNTNSVAKVYFLKRK